MRRTLSIASVTLAASVLVVLPAGSASAHVHGINPLRCTPAPPHAGGFQAVDHTPAGEVGGPLAGIGVIPIDMGGAVPLFGGGFNAIDCDPE